MTKIHRKAIKARSKLKITFNNERNVENWSNFKQQHTYC